MDAIVEFLRTHLYLLYVTGAVILIIKLAVVITNKGFNFTVIILSFFTFYSALEIKSTNIRKRAAYMWWNNSLNYLFYVWLIVFIFYTVVTLNVNRF